MEKQLILGLGDKMYKRKLEIQRLLGSCQKVSRASLKVPPQAKDGTI